MTYESTFGNLTTDGAKLKPAGAETPFRIAVWGDFSGRQEREPAGSGIELVSRKPLKVTFDTLDEVLESVGPRLRFDVAGGDVSVELEFTELDDFQPDPVARQVDRVSDLDDDGATQLMRQILHHPRYQAAESAWRGLEWLLRRVQKSDRIQVVLFDMTAEEFAADLMASDDLKTSAVYQLLIDKTAEAPDGQPWAVIASNYIFDETTAHAELLGRMARIAARAGAPFLAGVAPQAVEESYEVPAEGKAAWLALQALPEAMFLGLVVPRFLLRPPFGEGYRPAESFKFEEFAGTPDGYLWGNSAMACTALLAGGYMKAGWGFQQSQTLALDNMAMHSFRDAEGEAVAVCGEGRFTTTMSQELVKRGFMPLLSVRGRDAIELACIRPLAAEVKVLSGRWQGGQGGPPPGRVGVPKVGVGMMAKASGAAGSKAPNREGPAFVSAAPAPDPEVDADLAALLAGDDSPPADEAPPDEPPADEAPAADAAPTEELDSELAALLGGDSPPAEETPAAESPAEELDPELAALLGDTPAAEPAADAPAAAEELDPELAALLGDAPAESPSAEEPAAAEELDPELAALLGETAAADPAPPDEPPAAEEETMDPELAALLGGGDESPAEPAPAEEALDPELAALLGGEATSGDDVVAEPEAAKDESEEKTDLLTTATNTVPAMATVTDDLPDLGDDSDAAAASAPASAAGEQDIDALIAQVQAASKYGAAGTGSPSVIDFKSLLAPISAEEPAGGGVPFDVREQLEQARKEVNPEAFAPDDPMRPDDLVKADWAGIIAITQETLRNTSKNLLVAARLLEALTKKHGYAGLRDGLHLMRLLVEVCWDRLDPPLEDEDMEVRSAPFNWLDDPDRGACFPNSVRATVLLSADGNQFSQLQWQQSQGGATALGEMVEKTVRAASRDQCQTATDNLAQALMELKFLVQFLREKIGAEAPGMTFLRPAVEECLKLAQQILQRKGPATTEEAAGGGEAGAGGDGVAGGAPGKPRLSNREEIYRELALAADALERLEPHSPVPFLVRRAVEFGSLPFPQLMAALIRDVNVLSEMNRELGIKTPEATEAT